VNEISSFRIFLNDIIDDLGYSKKSRHKEQKEEKETYE